MEMSSELAETVFSWANTILVASLVVGVLATWAIVASGNARDRALKRELSSARERTAVLENEAARTREHAALIEHDLLGERRLTAKERWRLERVEKSIFPRELTEQQFKFIVKNFEGKIETLPICVMRGTEPRMFAKQIQLALLSAHVRSDIIVLSEDAAFFGVSVYVESKDGEQIANMLGQIGLIGGWVRGAIKDKFQPIGQTCLMVGDNPTPYSPPDGQPGEGLDENNRPVPAP